MADARQHRFAVVLVAAFDRVARSTRHFLQVVDELDSLGIAFISRREGINTDDHNPMGRLFLTIIGSIAELESDLIRERVLAGMRRAKLDGVRIGRAPMNIDRAAIVRDRLSGMTLTAVSKKWGFPAALFASLVKRSRAGDEGSCCRLPALLILFTLCGRVQPGRAGEKSIESSPLKDKMMNVRKPAAKESA